MPNVRGCNLAENRLYDVDNHIWLQDLGDGRVKIGMTSVATAMAGQLVAFTPKKVGRSVKPGKSCATVESGKWVGPAKSAVGGEVLEADAGPVGTGKADEEKDGLRVAFGGLGDDELRNLPRNGDGRRRRHG